MVNFVLVHGMFHGGWCWDQMKTGLEAAGHTVTAPDLPGCGSDRTPATEVTLEGWAGSIAAIAKAAPEKVILVGHSRGGLVVSQAAELASEKVAAIVYLTALLLPDGKAAANLPEIMASQGYEQGLEFAPRFSEDGLFMLPPEGSTELFYGACTPEIRAWASALVGKEPIAPLMTPVSVTPRNWGSLPKIYIETTEDQVLPITAQRAMTATVKPNEIITMHTGHMPILTDVAELSGILDGIARRYAA